MMRAANRWPSLLAKLAAADALDTAANVTATLGTALTATGGIGLPLAARWLDYKVIPFLDEWANRVWANDQLMTLSDQLRRRASAALSPTSVTKEPLWNTRDMRQLRRAAAWQFEWGPRLKGFTIHARRLSPLLTSIGLNAWLLPMLYLTQDARQRLADMPEGWPQVAEQLGRGSLAAAGLSTIPLGRKLGPIMERLGSRYAYRQARRLLKSPWLHIAAAGTMLGGAGMVSADVARWLKNRGKAQ